jgi:hypothetical protein
MTRDWLALQERRSRIYGYSSESARTCDSKGRGIEPLIDGPVGRKDAGATMVKKAADPLLRLAQRQARRSKG